MTWKARQYVTKDGLVVDHLDGNTHNNDPANLVPSCQRCNIRKRYDRIQDDEPQTTPRKGRRVRGEVRACLTCGNPFVARSALKGPREGIYCSRPCQYAAMRKGQTLLRAQ